MTFALDERPTLDEQRPDPDACPRCGEPEPCQACGPGSGECVVDLGPLVVATPAQLRHGVRGVAAPVRVRRYAAADWTCPACGVALGSEGRCPECWAVYAVG